MLGRLSAQLRSYFPAATVPDRIRGRAAPDGSSDKAAGCHPVAIALAEAGGSGEPWRRSVFGRFGDLPDDVLAHVTGYVTPDEFGPWSRICRQAFVVLRPEQLWRQLPGAVANVVSLTMLRAAVRDIEQWTMPRASHWLAALAARLPLLEERTWTDGLAMLLDAAARLPPSRQGAVLQAIAAARARCARADAPTAIGLPLEQRLLGAALVLAMEGDVQPFCIVVSYGSYDLAQSRSAAKWDDIVRALPAPCRAHALVAVQARLDRIWRAATNQEAWADRVSLAAALPVEDRDLALIALALPNAHLAPADAQHRFETMLALAPSLPPPQRSGLHAALACLTMVLPQRQVRAAWSAVMAAVAELGPAGAADVCPYLYGALACMPEADRHACGQALAPHLRGCAASLSAAAADITRARPAGEHPQLVLAVRDTRYWVTLPQRPGAAVVRFLRAEHAIVPAAALSPARAAAMAPAWRARALEYRASHLQNLNSEPGFSLDVEDVQWNALLESTMALPEDAQRAPLAALAGAVERSIALFTAQTLLITYGHPGAGPTRVTASWRKLVTAARRLPIAHQIELAMRLAPRCSAEALAWIFDVARAAPAARKAELLLGLLRNSEEHGSDMRSRIWSNVFALAEPLPRLARMRVLSALQDAFPPATALGWDWTTARTRLREAVDALRART